MVFSHLRSFFLLAIFTSLVFMATASSAFDQGRGEIFNRKVFGNFFASYENCMGEANLDYREKMLQEYRICDQYKGNIRCFVTDSSTTMTTSVSGGDRYHCQIIGTCICSA